MVNVIFCVYGDLVVLMFNFVNMVYGEIQNIILLLFN